MKKNLLFLPLVLAGLALSGCSKYDDSALSGRMTQMEGRVAKLEEQVKALNSDIVAIRTLITALENKDYVTKVEPITEGSRSGYRISFTKLSPITIYHGTNGTNGRDGANGAPGRDGVSPVIGVRQEGGIYYWTLNGQWLTDAEGRRVKAEGRDGASGASGVATAGRDGITPQLKIEGEYWHVSYDNGQTWQNLNVKARGEQGDRGEQGLPGIPGRDGAPGESSTSALFSDVQENDGYVTLTLRSGTKLLIPKGSPIAITFGHTSDIRVLAGKKYSIPYTITGANAQTKIEALAQDGFRAVVKPTNESTGFIEVTTPATIQESRVLVFVTDGRERTIMRSIVFVEGLIRIPTRNYTAEFSGGDVVVDLDTNMDYTIRIPEATQPWVSHVSTNARAVMRSERLLFRVNPNATTQERYVAIDLVDNLGVTSETILINQRGRATMQNTTFVEHKYLVTEFVGQDCHNCYQPLETMRRDKERNGQKLALITMHPIARLSSDVYCSDAASYIDALIGRRAVPNLAFNTLKDNREDVGVMERRPDAIELQGGLQLSERKVKLNLKAIQRTGQSERLQGRQLKLLLWAVEEGVTAAQINDSRSWVRNYLYHGLFRGSLNGVWGIDLTLGNRYDLEYTLPASLGNLDQSYLYILVCDAATHETLDVSSIALTKK